jgi:hypothetical protein
MVDEAGGSRFKYFTQSVSQDSSPPPLTRQLKKRKHYITGAQLYLSILASRYKIKRFLNFVFSPDPLLIFVT